MSFKASYDTTTKVISAAIFILFLMIAADTKSLVSEGIFALLFAAAYAWSPTGYEIAEGQVVIRRWIGNVRIPVNGIREIRLATRDDLSGSMRLFGSGGLFGYYGLFRNSKLGAGNWYVTDRSRSVVLVGDSGTAIVSPDNPADFIAAIGERRAIAPPANSPGIRASWTAAARLIGGATILAAVFLHAPGPPGYTLTKESLAIHDHFYPVTLEAANVDTDKIRVIDLNNDADWRPVARTNGFGSEHYHSGWFRVSSGKEVRMYRADSQQLVLLPPKGGGTPVLLETEDPEKFVGQVRQEWD
jgi:hypothetical protein